VKLTRLEIENVRAIEKLEIDLAQADGGPRKRLVLVGPNGCGKTTVLAAIADLVQRAYGLGTMQAAALGPRDVRIDPRSAGLDNEVVSRITADVVLSPDEHARIRKTAPEAASTTRLTAPLGSWPEGTIFYGPSGRDMIDETGRGLVTLNPTFPPAILLGPFRGVMPAMPARLDPLDMLNVEPREGALSTAPDRFSLLQIRLALAANPGGGSDWPDRLKRMWKLAERYVPYLPQPIDLRRDGLWMRTRRGGAVPLDRLSAGERAFILVCAEVALRNPVDGIVMIDEPEQHLHPRWQKELLEFLPALVPTAQFIYATQAPYILKVAPDDVVKIGDWGEFGE
jgi:predicted ATPase